MKIVKRVWSFLLWLSCFFLHSLPEKKSGLLSQRSIHSGNPAGGWWNGAFLELLKPRLETPPPEVVPTVRDPEKHGTNHSFTRSQKAVLPDWNKMVTCFFNHDEMFREVFLGAKTLRGWDVEIWKKIPSDKMDSFVEAAVSLELMVWGG